MLIYDGSKLAQLNPMLCLPQSGSLRSISLRRRTHWNEQNVKAEK